MEKPMIYDAICGVMEDIGIVGKNDYNKQQGFKYRGIDAVMNALNPAMIKHKIFCVPEILEQSREERQTKNGASLIYSVCKIRYHFYAADGSQVEAVVVGEGMDSGDKATNKAMSVAFKYACFQTFCIPTEDMMDDPDASTPPESSKKEDPELESLIEQLASELIRTGYGKCAVLKKYKVESMSQLSKLQIKDCITKMKNLPDKKEEAAE